MKNTTENNEMRLYVWNNVFTDYTDGMAFAIGTSLEEAAIAACKELNTYDIKEYDLNDLENDRGRVRELLDSPVQVFDLNSPIGSLCFGGG
jgi:hypothetical protein